MEGGGEPVGDAIGVISAVDGESEFKFKDGGASEVLGTGWRELRHGGGGRVRDVLHFAARCLGSWMCGGLGIRDLGQGLGPLSEFVDIWGTRMDGFVCGE